LILIIVLKNNVQPVEIQLYSEREQAQ